MAYQTSFLVLLVLLVAFFETSLSADRIHLKADGGDAYHKIIEKMKGGTPYEVPDCAHESFGPHIQEKEVDGRQAFAFYMHVEPDNDRCKSPVIKQRNEIKLYSSTDEDYWGRHGRTMSYSWIFKIDSEMQTSTSFTHLHQIKAVGGDDSHPLITITAASKSSGRQVFQVRYIGYDGKTVEYLADEDLSDFTGRWLRVDETLTYTEAGEFYMKITDNDSGRTLIEISEDNINMWRSGEVVQIRPKWGIYRSLSDPSALRDEVVYFDEFCMSSKDDSCV